MPDEITSAADLARRTAQGADRRANPYLGHWWRLLEHQRQHGSLMPAILGEPEQPNEYCLACLEQGIKWKEETGNTLKGPQKEYSWAIPDEDALSTIARYSPAGVVEIGAGGGYWAWMLRERGLDVIAYDPAPTNSDWHAGKPWTEVLYGDHTSVIGHRDRTLLLVWPSYEEPWPAQCLELYDGSTVIYVGEGRGGCTADDRFHALLGEPMSCWKHWGEDVCTCGPMPDAVFGEVHWQPIPQWFGLHDRLKVYQRGVSGASTG